MKVKLLKDTPDLKAGAIFSTIDYNASTRSFIDNFEDYHWSHLFNFLHDDFTNHPDSVNVDDLIYYTKERMDDLIQAGWFEIIEEWTLTTYSNKIRLQDKS